MGESFIFMLMFALGGGGGGDLLDFGDTASYWTAHDQRVIDLATMSAVLQNDKASAADQLMAIRALGELGRGPDADVAVQANIMKVLVPLVDSKEPFVGQYAKRSIAWIKGEDPQPLPSPSAKDLAGDLAILPHTSQIVGQLRIPNGGGPADWDKLLAGFKGELAEQKQQMIGEINQRIVQIVGLIGNARIDAVTVGATFFDNGNNDGDGYAMIVGRGQYDRVAVQLALQDMAEKSGDEGWSFYSIGDIEVITKAGEWENFVMLMPSDNQFIFMVGESDMGLKMYPIDETADLIKKGDAQPTFNARVMAQLNKIDRDKADAFVAMEFPAFMRNDGDFEEVIGPFHSGHVVAVRNGTDSFDVTWQADGDDAAGAGEIVAMLNEQLNHGRAEIRQEAARNPEMQALFEPMIKMMDSMKIEADGKSMKGGMKLPGGLGVMLPMFAMSVRHEFPAPAEGALPAEAIEDNPF